MCRNILWVFVLVMFALPLSGETWYVRKDGGTRYSANMRSGQCDGKTDAAYPGGGTNKHCAFNDYRYLWDDRSYGNSKWVIAGGDTVILKDGPWRVGFSANNNSDVWCFGGNGPYACTNPTIPAGTATQHTRILGEHYANCSNKGSETQIFGGFGVQTALNLRGAQFVDIECIEVTRHSQCVLHGDPAVPGGCNKNYPGLDDYDGDGIATDVKTHDLLLQDMWIHGHTNRGIIGPIGGTVTATRVDIAYNGMGGWDFDDGSSTASINGVWNFNESVIEWNGCNQEYPIKSKYPAISCYGQSNGGYGDGVGTPPGMCLTTNITQSIFRYNTQDGLDLGHADSGRCPMTIDRSQAYANSGGQFKWGPNENPVIFTNNLVLANCLRMSAPIEGAPNGFNAHLGDFCRAGDAVAFNFRQGGTVLFANNTIVTYAPTSLDVQCWDAPDLGKPFSANTGCANATLTFKNNIVFGYDNPHTYSLGGKPGGPSGFYFEGSIGHIIRSNNLYYGIRDIRLQTVFSGDHYGDPQFVSQPRFSKEQDLDAFDFHLSPSSPARGTGARLPEVHSDFDGKPRPSTGNYDIGAHQH